MFPMSNDLRCQGIQGVLCGTICLCAFELRGRIGVRPTLLITDIGIFLANSGMGDEFRSTVGENVSV